MIKKRSILPGFGITMGYATLYLSLIVVIPLAAMCYKSASISWAELRETLSDAELIGSLKLTFGLALMAAVVNAVFGFVVAWTLARYRFPGHRLIDGLVDLPFALPTAVSGITLATLYSANGWLGVPWAKFATWVNGVTRTEALPEQLAYTTGGMLVAMIFIGLPFVVRTLQPALDDLDLDVEEAAASLGATRVQTFFRIVGPSILPALLTGFSLAFARAVGEYGAVIFISSNIPGETEITAHMIMKKLENNDYVGATTLGVIMLIVSFVMLGTINGLQWWSSRRVRGGMA